MAGVTFIISIPTEREEHSELNHLLTTDCKMVTVNMNPVIESEEKVPNIQTPLINRKLIDPNKMTNQPIHMDEQSKQMTTPIGLSLDIPLNSSMEVIVRELLRKMKIKNATWTVNNSQTGYQIVFTMGVGHRQERLLSILMEWGIGERNMSSVSVIPCSAYYKGDAISERKRLESMAGEDDLEREKLFKKPTSWTRFVNSVRARMNVERIVGIVKHNASITFDFIILLIVAGLLAAVGLVEDSTIFLASSMLISPLMGPIIATIFGTVIKDRKLTKFGIINETIGLCLATLVGFLFGLIVCSIDKRYGIGEGLTQEILSRCEMHSLIVGVFTAIPSGVAVAIAILGENIGSMVGVAISASLLPPAVNTGLLWALACLYLVYESDDRHYNSVIKTNIYSDHQAVELAIFGCISMLVTFVNIICIYAAGILVLKIKEVAPMTSRNQSQFWKHDIKVARDFNKSYDANDPVTRKLAEDIVVAENRQRQQSMDASSYNNQMSGSGLIRPFSHTAYQHTWSPMTTNRPNSHSEKLYPMHGKSAIEIHNDYLVPSSMATCIPQIINRRSNVSPPGYKSLLDDDLPKKPFLSRRSSMPFFVRNIFQSASPKSSPDSIDSPNVFDNAPGIDGLITSNRALPKIPEIVQTSNPDCNDRKLKNSDVNESHHRHKFIVTPASDPPLSSFEDLRQ